MIPMCNPFGVAGYGLQLFSTFPSAGMLRLPRGKAGLLGRESPSGYYPMILIVIPEIGCHTLPYLQGVVGFICLPEEREKGKPDREGGELLILSIKIR